MTGDEAGHESGHLLAGALAEVGDLQQIGQYVITIKLHQGIGVEDHRGDTADDHRIERQLVDQPGRGHHPDQNRQGGQN